ncbi:MAG: hypothetical protein E6P95_01025 [Candidatus Moraniibacteriota bacterium]|nr:MAG: hypothetical protein E6P95_01025 [Candidatus Moranbacteria bacterium]
MEQKQQVNELQLVQDVIASLGVIFAVEMLCLIVQNWDTFSPMAHVLIDKLSIAGQVLNAAKGGAEGLWSYVKGDVHVNGNIADIAINASQQDLPRQVSSWGMQLDFVTNIISNLTAKIPR